MKPKLTITASKEIEEAANDRNSARSIREAALNNFVSALSHQKRGPVGAIYTGGPLVANVDVVRPILSAPITMVVPMNWKEDAKHRIIFETAFAK